jgi:hypothetical protein
MRLRNDARRVSRETNPVSQPAPVFLQTMRGGGRGPGPAETLHLQTGSTPVEVYTS